MVCYCNQITRTEIEETIKKKGTMTISEVKNHLRDTITSKCSELNPTGKCCHVTFQAVIDEAKRSRKFIPVLKAVTTSNKHD